VEENDTFAVGIKERAYVRGIFEFRGFAEGELGCEDTWCWHFNRLSERILLNCERESLYVEMFRDG
jgi:hypothetical protein